jgi:hypothetical protein
MLTHAHPKVSAQNLQREAFIYVRQSTPRQVVENIESTQRQGAKRFSLALHGRCRTDENLSPSRWRRLLPRKLLRVSP